MFWFDYNHDLKNSITSAISSIKYYQILGFRWNTVNFNQTNFLCTFLITLLPILHPKKVTFYSLNCARQQWTMESEMSLQQQISSDSWAVISLKQKWTFDRLDWLEMPSKKCLPTGILMLLPFLWMCVHFAKYQTLLFGTLCHGLELFDLSVQGHIKNKVHAVWTILVILATLLIGKKITGIHISQML